MVSVFTSTAKIWLSGKYNSVKGVWQWSDGSFLSAGYTNWQTTSVGTVGGAPAPGYECLAMGPSTGYWTSGLCSDTSHVMCVIP
jgi:hypothetical protein